MEPLAIKSKTINSDFIKSDFESFGFETMPIITQQTTTEVTEVKSQKGKDIGVDIKIFEPQEASSNNQWATLESQISSFVDGPIIKTDSSRMNIEGVDETTTIRKQSYSYTEKHTTYTEPTHTQQQLIDHSTTLIKEIHPHYEPVQLVVQSHSRNPSRTISRTHSRNHSQNNSLSNSCTYIKDIGAYSSSHFEPIALIVKKTSERSGSLPPVTKKHIRRYEIDDNEEEVYYYYTDRTSGTSLNNFDNKVTYYTERVGKPAFDEVELIIDGSSLQTEHLTTTKRVRDMSLPNRTRKIKIPINKNYQNVYRYEYEEDSGSDFISDYERPNKQVYYQHGDQTSTIKSTFVREKTDITTLPPINMTLEMKVQPTVELHLRDLDANEGNDIRLDCVVNGN